MPHRLLSQPGMISLTVFVALGVLTMIGLGIWQLERLEQRQERNALILARLEQPEVVIEAGNLEKAMLPYQPVVVAGTFDSRYEFVLRNRAREGVPGIRLVTPLRIDGASSAVLVDRGWLPIAESTPEVRQAYEREGKVVVHGIVRESQERPSVLAPADPTIEPNGPFVDAWFRVNIPSLQQQVPYPLLPYYIQQTENEERGHYLIAGADFDLSEGPHLGYAIQWFTFALILVVGYIAYLRRRLL